MSKKPISIPSTHPALGTLIDNNTLQLVEVLGIGGYGVVYRAVETFSSARRSYAVKCLANAHGKHGHSLRRQVHIREITLHQLASAHPGIVSLYRVVDEAGYLYIIMEFATDDDLFTQILHRSRYLGDNDLIKHVFLQIIDGVQYCHSLGIYHRDLKPENVLCFDEGYRVAITDFGLATTDKSSKEFRTGSIYHMSPECQVEDTDTSPPYSPKHNDIWSLGIILLNLVTGRNPWKSATADDPTYQAYLQNPYQFLPSVLPVSQELNRLLVQALNVDWRRRLPLADFRAGVQKISDFYSDNAILEGSLARCPWEAGIDLGNGKPAQPKEKRPVPDIPDGIEPYCVVSMSAVMSNIKSQASGVESYFERETWDGEHSEYNYSQSAMDAYEDDYQTPYKSTGRSSYSSDPSEPTTPSSAGRSLFAGIQDTFDLESL
ncbi:kinase-like protein [Agrocybe pediades]|nr:kinase-like protein [Agrocybe pediades]